MASVSSRNTNSAFSVYSNGSTRETNTPVPALAFRFASVSWSSTAVVSGLNRNQGRDQHSFSLCRFETGKAIPWHFLWDLCTLCALNFLLDMLLGRNVI